MMGWIWKGLLALVGSVAAAYVGAGVLGGGALGWIVGGVILGPCVYPLLKSVIDRRAGR
jgi:hypothetical protein